MTPWTERIATLGAELDEVRATLLAELEPAFAEHAATLGLDAATLGYAPDPPTVEALEERFDRDLARGHDVGSDRTYATWQSSRPAGICAASAPRASSAPPCSRSSSRRPT